jgi:hypothetical protein
MRFGARLRGLGLQLVAGLAGPVIDVVDDVVTSTEAERETETDRERKAQPAGGRGSKDVEDLNGIYFIRFSTFQTTDRLRSAC